MRSFRESLCYTNRFWLASFRTFNLQRERKYPSGCGGEAGFASEFSESESENIESEVTLSLVIGDEREKTARSSD